MGRRPKLRVSFSDDAAYLLRLAKAIEMDASLPLEWRAETHEMVMALARRFMTPPNRAFEPSESRKRKLTGS